LLELLSSISIPHQAAMDADEILLIATLAAVFPYLAVAASDWIMRRKRDRDARAGADAP
jgi:amino acid transporter